MTTLAQATKAENRLVLMGGVLFVGIALLTMFGGKKKGRKFTKGLVVGDSLSSLPDAMGGMMQKLLIDNGVPTERVFNSGKGTYFYIGEEPGASKKRPSPITQALSTHKPDLLVVILGANDFREGLDAGDWRPKGLHRKGPLAPREAKYKGALEKFVSMAKAEGVKKIIWIGPSKQEDDPRGKPRKHGSWGNHGTVRVAQWQQEQLIPLGVEWHDSQSKTKDLQTRDGIHFYPKESAAWARRMAKEMSVLPA